MATQQPFWGNFDSSTLPVTAGTVYGSIANSIAAGTAASLRQYVIAEPGNISAFMVEITNAAGASGSWDFYIYNITTATNLLHVQFADAVKTFDVDLSSVAVAKGDLIVMMLVTTGTP